MWGDGSSVEFEKNAETMSAQAIFVNLVVISNGGCDENVFLWLLSWELDETNG